MPLYFSSFVLPASASLPYLLEDKYVKGGYRSVANTAERDAIATSARKAGMRVYVQDSGLTFTVALGALTTWVEVPSKAVRSSQNYTASAPLAANGTLDFTLPTGKSAMILSLLVSHPSLKIEGFSSVSRNDTNPYTFVSYAGHLFDDGSSKLQDNSTFFGRRTAIIHNLEATVVGTTYWRITNTGASAVTPVVDVTWLPLE